MFTAYFKLAGSDYLWDRLALILNEINDMGEQNLKETRTSQAIESGKLSIQNRSSSKHSIFHSSIEVDPNKMSDGDDAELNILHLQFCAQKILKAITDTDGEIPTCLMIILSHVKNEVIKKYPNAEYTTIGGFFFLRFVCPSLIAPHLYGLTKEPPNENSQRMLILLSKLLQNLVNDTVPKEEFMKVMTEFIMKNKERLQKFYDSITILPDTKMIIDSWTIPPIVKLNCLDVLVKQVILNQSKLKNLF